MTQEWIIELREEIRQMVQSHAEKFRYYYIVAVERDEQRDDKPDDLRTGAHE
jgi:hypothetical protein